MNYQVTVRHGKKNQRYLTFDIEAPDVPAALRLASERIPQDIGLEADLVELRGAPDYEKVMPESEFAEPG